MNIKLIAIGIAVILVAVSVGVFAYSFVDQTEYRNVTFRATVEAYPIAAGAGGIEYWLNIQQDYTLSEPETFDFDWLFGDDKQGETQPWWDPFKSDGVVVEAKLQYENKAHTAQVDLGTFSSTVDSYKNFDIEFKNVEILNEYEYGTQAAYALSAKLISGGNTIINADFFNVYLLDDSNPPDIDPDDTAPEICLSPTYTTLEYTGEDVTNSYTVGQLLSHYDVEWELITEVIGSSYGDTTYNPDLGMSGSIVFPISKGDQIEIAVTTAGCFHINDFNKV